MKIDLSIFMSCKAGFLLTISLFGQQEVMTSCGQLKEKTRKNLALPGNIFLQKIFHVLKNLITP